MADSASRRALHERARRRRSLLVAAASSALLVAAVVVVVPRMPRWDRVRESFFNGERFRDSLPRLLDAFWLDVRIFLWTIPFIVAVALLVAVTRNSRSPVLFPLRVLAIAYTDIMRGVPVILWIYLIGFGVPGLGMERPWNSPLIWGSVALVLTYAAYVSEVFRAGIESVHESQRAAARSLGLGTAQTMRFVVPPLMNDLVSLQKDVALVSLIGPIEILRQAGVDKAKFANFTPYIAAAVVFLAVTVPLTRLTDWLVARERRRTTGTRVQ